MILDSLPILFLQWYFFDVPLFLLQAFKNFLRFGAYFFSIPVLIKTLFSHWHKFSWEYPRGFDLWKYIEVFLSNLISRVIGAVLRIVFILMGIIFEIFIFIGGIIVIFGWFLVPILLFLGLMYGIRFLFTI